jgi:ribosomal protein S18 acetylase RimI-like enzyme
VTGRSAESGDAARARAWRRAAQSAVCDVIEPWEHGTVVRATRHPRYFDFNAVRVEDDPGTSVDALVSFADEALAGLAHRRVDFEVVAAADALRAGFEALGWMAVRLVWMRHAAAAPPGPEAPVEEVPYDAVRELRLAWHLEDFPGQDPTAHYDGAREVALRRHAQVLAVLDDGAPVAFAQLEREGGGAEIAGVYVAPEHRGRGLGTAVTRAAIDAAGDVGNLWIVADDEDRPKQLYARLGFRPAWTAMEFLRLPERAPAAE